MVKKHCECFYDSLQGTADKMQLYDLNKFLQIKMRDNDLVGFDAEWENCLNKFEGIDCQMLTKTEAVLKLRYLEQVRYHPHLKYHMAQWSILPAEEQTYNWLRHTVKRVLAEQVVRNNDKVWQESRVNDVVSDNSYGAKKI